MPSRVAEILIEAAREQARAREQTGQIWGQTVANLGQVPGQVMAQQARLREEQGLADERQQRAALIASQLDQFKQARQTEAAVRGVLQKHANELIDQNTGHWNPPDAAITQELMQTSPQAAEQWMDYSTKFRDHDQKMQELHLAQTETRNNKWADDIRTVLEAPEDQRANVYAVRHGAWATMFPNDQVFKALPPVYTPEAAPVLRSVQKGLESESQRIARQKTAAEIAKANRIEVKPGEKVLQYDPAHPEAAPTVLAEGGPKVGTSLEEQYLEAMTKGDKATASRILGTLQATAAAKKDPAVAAQAASLRGLNIEMAKARLDALRSKPDKLVKVEHMDESTGKTVIEWLPQSELQGQVFKKGVGSTVESRLASAQAVNETGEDMIRKLSDPAYAAKVGPAMGRYNTLREFIGNPPPEFAELAGTIESYSLANMGVHGMRSAQGAEQIKKLLDQKHTPASLIATIRGLNAFSTHFMQNEGRGSAVAAPTSTPVPTLRFNPATGKLEPIGAR